MPLVNGTKRLKTWFFAKTADINSPGSRLLKADFPTEAVWRDLVENLTFKGHTEDQATPHNGTGDLYGKAGLVTVADDATAKSRLAKPGDRVVVPQVHQLPDIKSQSQVIDDFTGVAVEFPLDAAITTRDSYIGKFTSPFITWLTNRLPPEIEVTGKAALYVNGTEGDDATGDGSINKPFATLAQAKSVVQNGQTIIVYAATYTNTENMVKGGASETDKFVYTIMFNPGTVINQSTNAFLDNSVLHGVVHIFGKPDINYGAATAPVIVHSKRTGSGASGGGEIVQFLDFKTVYNSGTGPCIEIGGTQIGHLQINAANIYSVGGASTIRINGSGCAPIIKSASIGNGTTSGTADVIRIESAYAAVIYQTRIATTATGTYNLNGVKIVAAPSNGVTLQNCSWSLTGSSGTVIGVNIAGAGDISSNCIVIDSLIQGSALDHSFYGDGTTVGAKDVISVSNVRSNKESYDFAASPPADSRAVISEYGGSNGLLVGTSTHAFYTVMPYDF